MACGMEISDVGVAAVDQLFGGASGSLFVIDHNGVQGDLVKRTV